jgi:hypothetical protein
VRGSTGTVSVTVDASNSVAMDPLASQTAPLIDDLFYVVIKGSA